MSLSELKRDWEALAANDPLWAIVSDARWRFAKWDLADFFRTGEEQVGNLLEAARRFGCPAAHDLALDFGCGVGRLTRLLAAHFRQCYGVDISPRMVEQAVHLNRAVPNCTFLVNTGEHLEMFPADHFDLIYSNIVLQHLPNQHAIIAYIDEFVRTLRPGGLAAFQLPSRIPLRYRLQPRRRIYHLLRALGCSDRFLLTALRLHPIRLTAVPEHTVTARLEALGARVLAVEADSNVGATIESRMYYVTKDHFIPQPDSRSHE